MTAIEPKWLTEAAPNLFKTADPNAISKRKRQEKIAPLHDRHAASQECVASAVATRADTSAATGVSPSSASPRACSRPSDRSIGAVHSFASPVHLIARR